MGAAGNQRIDANNDLQFLHMKEREFVYIARARGLATKCISLSD